MGLCMQYIKNSRISRSSKCDPFNSLFLEMKTISSGYSSAVLDTEGELK